MRYFILILISVFIFNISSPAVAGPLERGIKAYEAEKLDKAIKILQPLAEKGNREAQYYMGNITRLLGDNQPEEERAKFYDTSRHWYGRAQASGHGQAAWNLGLMYEMGMLGAPDQEKADELYIKAARNNYEPAYFYAGEIYEQRSGQLRSTIYFYEKAANAGHAEAKLRFDKITQREQKIFDDLKAEADNGDVEAMMSVGHRYTNNRHPIDSDYKKAEEYFMMAAQAGELDGIFQVAKIHAGSYPYFEEDPLLAAKIAIHLAENGRPKDLYLIGKEFTYSVPSSVDKELEARLFALTMFDIAEEYNVTVPDYVRNAAQSDIDEIIADREERAAEAAAEADRQRRLKEDREFRNSLKSLDYKDCRRGYVYNRGYKTTICE